MKFLLYTVFILVLFLPNADASDYDIFMRRGLKRCTFKRRRRVRSLSSVYESRLRLFSRSKDSFELLALSFTRNKRITPIYPRQAQQSGYNAVVVAELIINDDGTVRDPGDTIM